MKHVRSYLLTGASLVIFAIILGYANLPKQESNWKATKEDSFCSFVIHKVSSPSLIFLDINKNVPNSTFLPRLMEKIKSENLDFDFEVTYDPWENAAMGNIPAELQTWPGWNEVTGKDITMIPCSKSKSDIPEPNILILFLIGLVSFFSIKQKRK